MCRDHCWQKVNKIHFVYFILKLKKLMDFIHSILWTIDKTDNIMMYSLLSFSQAVILRAKSVICMHVCMSTY